jgi:hypothetical protein
MQSKVVLPGISRWECCVVDGAGVMGEGNGEWVGLRGRLANFEMAAAARLEDHRPAPTGHRYGMLGPAVEAEDAVQDERMNDVS